MVPPASADSIDLDAAVIADAATRLAILRRLADLGMTLAEEVVERAVNSPYHPEPRHEPARAFAAVSRAVRLTLVLQERMETRLVALRKGETLPARRPARVRTERSTPAGPDDPPDSEPNTSDRSNETLRERDSERFDERLEGPFEDCVAAIRADLGLKPSESIPEDEREVQAALRNVPRTASTARAAPYHPGPAASTALRRVLTPHPPDSG